MNYLTAESAQAKLAKAAAEGGGITIHRRPKSGSVICWGGCGKTISANKAFCYSCQCRHDRGELHPAQAAGQAEGEIAQPGTKIEPTPMPG